MKKITALLLSILMIVGVFSGCSKNEPIESEPTIETQPQPIRPTTLNWEFKDMSLPTISVGEKEGEKFSTFLGTIDEVDEKITNSEVLNNNFSLVESKITGTYKTHDHNTEDQTQSDSTQEQPENELEATNSDAAPATETPSVEEPTPDTQPENPVPDQPLEEPTVDENTDINENEIISGKQYIYQNDEMRIEITTFSDYEFFNNVSNIDMVIYMITDGCFTSEHQTMITEIAKDIFGEEYGYFLVNAKDPDGKYHNDVEITDDAIKTGAMTEVILIGETHTCYISRITNIPSAREQMAINIMFLDNNA